MEVGKSLQEREIPLLQPPPRFLGPLLVAVGRQELSGVEVESHPVDRRFTRAAGTPGGFLESVHVHPQETLWAQHKRLIPRCQVAGTHGRVESPASGVYCLAQVVGGRTYPKLRPECVHNLLAVETVPSSQCEELDKARRLPKPPSTLPYDSSPHGDLEATEQPDAYGLESLGGPLGVPSHLGIRSPICHLSCSC